MDIELEVVTVVIMVVVAGEGGGEWLTCARRPTAHDASWHSVQHLKSSSPVYSEPGSEWYVMGGSGSSLLTQLDPRCTLVALFPFPLLVSKGVL